MTIIKITNGHLDITLTDRDQFWTLKKQFSIPLDHIKSVEIKPPPRLTWKTIRAPGTHWPGKITAGSYWSWETKEWSFWNIRKAERVLVIDLEEDKYSQLVLEVEDPDRVVEMVKRAVA